MADVDTQQAVRTMMTLRRLRRWIERSYLDLEHVLTRANMWGWGDEFPSPLEDELAQTFCRFTVECETALDLIQRHVPDWGELVDPTYTRLLTLGGPSPRLICKLVRDYSVHQGVLNFVCDIGEESATQRVGFLTQDFLENGAHFTKSMHAKLQHVRSHWEKTGAILIGPLVERYFLAVLATAEAVTMVPLTRASTSAEVMLEHPEKLLYAFMQPEQK